MQDRGTQEPGLDTALSVQLSNRYVKPIFLHFELHSFLLFVHMFVVWQTKKGPHVFGCSVLFRSSAKADRVAEMRRVISPPVIQFCRSSKVKANARFLSEPYRSMKDT